MRKGVYLIGAGPGDLGLITSKGLEILNTCDVVVYDQLANPEFLNFTKENCEFVYVGKKSENHSLSQGKINELLFKLAKENQVIVRLKGGDPFVFGRGSEEFLFLKSNEIHVEVISGVTSAISGLSSAGIPITSRELARSFHVITGHISKNGKKMDYSKYANLGGTLVFLMGVANLSNIVSQLLKGGQGKNTPVAIIYKATTVNQQVYLGTLENIVEIANNENIQAPSLIVVGETVNLHNQLYAERKSINVLVACSKNKFSDFANLLDEIGANVSFFPTIKFEKKNEEILYEELENITKYDLLVFTSSYAVDVFMTSLLEISDIRKLFNIEIVVVGKKTAGVLGKYGLKDLTIAKDYSQQGIIDILSKEKYCGKKVFLPQSTRADKKLENILNKHLEITQLDIYCCKTDFKSYWSKEALEASRYICFTSASTVKGFVEILEKNDVELLKAIKNKKIVAIGPVTKNTIEEYNMKVDIVPIKATIEEMVKCIEINYREISNE